MEYVRKILRFIVALVSAPLVWFVFMPFWLFLDFLAGDPKVAKDRFLDHWAWLTFKGDK